jgi:hypothetical protein
LSAFECYVAKTESWNWLRQALGNRLPHLTGTTKSCLNLPEQNSSIAAAHQRVAGNPHRFEANDHHDVKGYQGISSFPQSIARPYHTLSQALRRRLLGCGGASRISWKYGSRSCRRLFGPRLIKRKVAESH